MGLIRQGILGGFRKKTGTVVGAYWRRLDVIRALPRSSGKAPTQLQLNQQFKFGLVTSFLSNFSSLIDDGFKTANMTASPMNVAVSYHLKTAITGLAPNFEIDLTKVIFSLGKLELPPVITAVANAGAQVVLSWTNTAADDKFIDGTDVLVYMIYNEAQNKFVKTVTAIERTALNFTVELPDSFIGEQVHIYAGFRSTKKKMLQSPTTYLGTKTIS